MDTLPEHVRSAFHAESGEALSLSTAWDNGWRVGKMALMPVVQTETASISAKLRDHLKPQHVRLARPVRATDGRYVVSGWRASLWEPGELQAGRVDETAVAALRLADALATEKIPPAVQAPITGPWQDSQVFLVADRAAWAADPAAILSLGLGGQASEKVEFALRLAARIVPLIPPIEAPNQLGHADMLATTIWAGSQDPVVTDLVPVAHPHGYTAAQVIVDGLLADAVDRGIIMRFGSVPDIIGLLLRALLYRTFVHGLSDGVDVRNEARLEQVLDWIIRG
ncbi:TIGR02569 family protein [Staphylococcus chromogenes]|nr:TIGR02569 family protein [Staphylococcus chromogenes]